MNEWAASILYFLLISSLQMVVLGGLGYTVFAIAKQRGKSVVWICHFAIFFPVFTLIYMQFPAPSLFVVPIYTLPASTPAADEPFASQSYTPLNQTSVLVQDKVESQEVMRSQPQNQTHWLSYISNHWEWILLGCWIFGVVLLSARLLRQWVWIRNTIKQCTPIDSETIVNPAEECRQIIGLKEKSFLMSGEHI